MYKYLDDYDFDASDAVQSMRDWFGTIFNNKDKEKEEDVESTDLVVGSSHFVIGFAHTLGYMFLGIVFLVVGFVIMDSYLMTRS